jgi:hypothetical protein
MTTRAEFWVVVVALIASSTSAESLPNNCAILPKSEDPALIRQCSRGSPTNVSSFWTPSATQIQAIEQRLPELLAKSGHNLKLSDGYHQYIGVTSHGIKLIYLNSFPRFVLDYSEGKRDWRVTAVTVCDGGDVFWGLEFDPADSTFHHLEFNGEA